MKWMLTPKWLNNSAHFNSTFNKKNEKERKALKNMQKIKNQWKPYKLSNF